MTALLSKMALEARIHSLTQSLESANDLIRSYWSQITSGWSERDEAIRRLTESDQSLARLEVQLDTAREDLCSILGYPLDMHMPDLPTLVNEVRTRLGQNLLTSRHDTNGEPNATANDVAGPGR